MRKTLKILLIFTLVFSFSSYSVLASDKDLNQKKAEIYEKTAEILSSDLSGKELEKALLKAGWIKVDESDSTFTGTDSTIMSLPGCGQTLINPAYYSPETNNYMISADWSFLYNKKDCVWDDSSGGALDYFALGVITNENKQVNQLAQSAGITVKDRFGSAFSAWGGVKNYNGSAVTYTISDNGGPSTTHVGSQGRAWFFINRPTNTGVTFAVKAHWSHTWSSSTKTLQNVTVSFPWAVTATWSNNSTPSSWDAPNQQQISF